MALRESGRDKPGRAGMAEPDADVDDGPDLRTRIAATGIAVADLHPTGPDRLEQAGWSELIVHVRTGHGPFPGGALWDAATPAMLLIAVDGVGHALAFAQAGAREAAALIRRGDIGGSIGIDFPSVPERAGRQGIEAAIDAALPQPFERTAVNGFGFMQIIRRRERPSLIEQIGRAHV